MNFIKSTIKEIASARFLKFVVMSAVASVIIGFAKPYAQKLYYKVKGV